jgi:hypothetical protein
MLNDDETRSLDIKEFGVGPISGPAPQQNAGRESVLAWLRAAAVKAAREALSRDLKWKIRLRCLAGLEAGFAEETDLLPVQAKLRQMLEPKANTP